VNSINSYIERVIKRDIKSSNLEILQSAKEHLMHIESVIQKLVTYEVEVAHYERKNFLSYYNRLLRGLIIILAISIVIILVISYNVIKSIQFEHLKLQRVTQELKDTNKNLENASYTDALTNLNNRRFFNKIYKRELKRVIREKSYITFMMLDIDFFKQYNDTYGHIQGDVALKMVAQTLLETLKRPSDYVFRLGGEEFGVLLTNTNEVNSAKLAENINSAIRKKAIAHKTSRVNTILTISIGVVCLKADTHIDEDSIISKADKMLYDAKKQGRDMYVITSKADKTSDNSLSNS